MKIKYSEWTGTYWVFRPGKPVMLTKEPTAKMRRIMESEPKIDGIFKVWEERNGKHQR